MKAGKLRHKVQFQRLEETQDSDGFREELWFNFGSTVWVELQPLTGRELLSADATQSKISSRIIMRYMPGLLPSMRVVYRGVFYNIEAIIPDKISGLRELTLLLSSGTNDG